jgi:DNA-binding MarR family transcriptional regulator
MGFGESTPPAELSGYTGFLLNWVAAGSRQRFEAALGELGLKLPHFALMNVVAAEPGRTQQAIGEAIHIDPSTMVQVLDQLAEMGLAERRPHPEDRRKHTIHLTKQGEKLLEQARAAAGRAGAETFGALDAKERETFGRLLRKVAGVEEEGP